MTDSQFAKFASLSITLLTLHLVLFKSVITDEIDATNLANKSHTTRDIYINKYFNICVHVCVVLFFKL